MSGKQKILGVLMAFAIGFMPVSVSAVPIISSTSSKDVLFHNVCSSGGSTSAVCQGSGQSTNPISGPNGVLLKVSEVIALIAGVSAIIVILVSGLSFITSGGDPAKAQKARGALIGALAGLVIIVLAESIIGFVLSRI